MRGAGPSQHGFKEGASLGHAHAVHQYKLRITLLRGTSFCYLVAFSFACFSLNICALILFLVLASFPALLNL